MKTNMKVVKLLVFAMVIAFVAVVGCATAEDSTITGMVEQTDNGVILMADEGEFIVAGQDLSAMVGKKVTVTGTVMDSDAGKTITVISVEELAE